MYLILYLDGSDTFSSGITQGQYEIFLKEGKSFATSFIMRKQK